MATYRKRQILSIRGIDIVVPKGKIDCQTGQKNKKNLKTLPNTPCVLLFGRIQSDASDVGLFERFFQHISNIFPEPIMMTNFVKLVVKLGGGGRF